MPAKLPRLTKRAEELLELAQEAAARQGREEIDIEDLPVGTADQKTRVEELAEFANGLLAELIGPLRVIEGDAQLLYRVTELGEKRTRYFERIGEVVDDARALAWEARHLLWNIQYIASGPVRSPCDLKRLVLQGVGAKREHSSFQMTYDIPDGDWRVWGSDQLVLSVIGCLAQAATIRLPADNKVLFTLDRDGTGVWLRMRDQGPSITDDMRHHVLRKTYYFGMGHDIRALVVAVELVETLGGKFDIRNLPGHGAAVEGGAEFAVLFPSAIVISAGDDAPNNPTPS